MGRAHAVEIVHRKCASEDDPTMERSRSWEAQASPKRGGNAAGRWRLTGRDGL